MPKTNQQIAIEVLLGKWGNGYSRFQALTDAGYDASAIQSIVNSLVEDGKLPDVNPNKVELGTNTKIIDLDLSVYNSICLNLHFGDSDA